jgi:hypothetical protein
MAGQEVARKVLAAATARVGGIEALASRLEVSQRVVRHYLEGNEPIPDSLLLSAIDLIIEGLPQPESAQQSQPQHPTS